MPVAAEALRENVIPERVTAEYRDGILTIKGPKGSLSREFRHPRLRLEVKDGKVYTLCVLPRKKEKALVGTWWAHIRNMITGVTEGFEYRLKEVHSHFPMMIKFDKNARILSISNFLGEKSDRKAKILEGVDVRIDGDQVILTGINRENIGQSAANVERTTRIKGFDIRVFQDGVYITHKAIHGDAND